MPICPEQTHAALLRSTAARILLAADTLAGERVEEEMLVDPAMPGEMPRLIVMVDEDGTLFSTAGGPPRFKAVAKLVIQVLTQDAKKPVAVRLSDQLVAQAKAAVLCNPAFTSLVDTIDTIAVTTSLKGGSAQITADARIQLSCSYFEVFTPDLDVKLNSIVQTATLANGDTIVNTTTF